jgi:hypothetical protein
VWRMTPSETVLAALGNGPASSAMLASSLLRHGWAVTAVDAAIAHACHALLLEKRIACSEVDGVAVYHLPDAARMEAK